MTTPVLLSDATFASLAKAMEMTTLRQSVLAANLANVSTPGYTRHDVSFQAELARALESGRADAVAAVQGAVVEDESGAARADGNNVNISRETGAMMENGVYFNLLNRAFNTRLNILRNAMRG